MSFPFVPFDSPISATSSSSPSSLNTSTRSVSTSPSTPLSSYLSPKSTSTTSTSNTFTTRPPRLPPLPGPLRYIQLPRQQTTATTLAYCYRLITASAWVSLTVETPLGLRRPHLLIVFVNGADSTQSSWTLAVARYQSSSTLYTGRRVSILTFDRDGQGLSEGEAETTISTEDVSNHRQRREHDIDSLKNHVEDLRSMIETALAVHHTSASDPSSSSPRTSPTPSASSPSSTQPEHSSSPFNIVPEISAADSIPPLLLVAHDREIGIPIAKLFTETYPDDVAGLLFLHDAQEDTASVGPPGPRPHLHMASQSGDLARSMSSMDIGSISGNAPSGARTAEKSRWGGIVRELRGIDSLSRLPNSEMVGNELGGMVQRILGLG